MHKICVKCGNENSFTEAVFVGNDVAMAQCTHCDEPLSLLPQKK